MCRIFSIVGLGLLLAASLISLVAARVETGVLVPIIEVVPMSLASTQAPGIQASTHMTISNLGGEALDWRIIEDATLAGWSENFDNYDTGSQLHSQGGWKGWNNNPAGGAVVTDTFSTSAPNAVAIVGASDIVRGFSGYTSGDWVFTAWQIFPPGFAGDTYFILLNQYADGGPYNWSTQVQFSSSAGQVINTGASGGTLPLLINQRVELRLEINLDQDTQAFYYNNQLLYSGTWTGEVSGSGVLDIGAVGLFANGASPVYYDDFSLRPQTPSACESQGELPWVSAGQTSGATDPAGQSPVDVTFDSTGLATGMYTGTLCVLSSDLVTPEVSLPLTLTVELFKSYLPVIEKN